jgi:hypothetical protein
LWTLDLKVLETKGFMEAIVHVARSLDVNDGTPRAAVCALPLE